MAIKHDDYIIDSFAGFVYGNKTDEKQIRDLRDEFSVIVNYEDDSDSVKPEEHTNALILIQKFFKDGLSYLSQAEETSKYYVFIGEISRLDTADKMIDWVSRLIPEQDNLVDFLR